ncbi:uncharacterized protein LOC144314275 isoform X3 [Canis aureus]
MLLVKFLEQVYEACLVGYHETCGDENRRVCIVISYQFQAWRTEPHTTGSYSLVVEDFSTEATEKLHLCCPNVLSGSPVSVLANFVKWHMLNVSMEVGWWLDSQL